MYVHHPDKGYDQTERVGARIVKFEAGRAEVTVASVLRHYRAAGYAMTAGKRRPAVAGEAAPIESVDVVDPDAWVTLDETDPVSPVALGGDDAEAEE